MIILKLGFLVNYHKYFKEMFIEYSPKYEIVVDNNCPYTASLLYRKIRYETILQYCKEHIEKTIYVDTVEDNIGNNIYPMDFIKEISKYHEISLIFVLPDNTTRLKNMCYRIGNIDKITTMDQLIKYRYISHILAKYKKCDIDEYPFWYIDKFKIIDKRFFKNSFLDTIDFDLVKNIFIITNPLNCKNHLDIFFENLITPNNIHIEKEITQKKIKLLKSLQNEDISFNYNLIQGIPYEKIIIV